MAHYDMLTVLPGTLAEDELPAIITSVEKHLTEQGASNVTVVDEGKNRLAYPMKQIRYGYFHNFRFEAEPTAIPQIQGKLRLVTQLLRSLIERINPEEKALYASRMADAAARSEKYGKKVAPAPEAPAKKEASKTPAKAKKETATAAEKKTEDKNEEKIDIKDIDEKLDKILDSSIANL